MSIKSLVKNILGIIRCTISGVKAGKNVYVGKNVKFTGGKNIILSDNANIRPGASLFAEGIISVGSGTEVGDRCRFSAVKHIEIGNDIGIAPNVFITDCDHIYEDITKPIIHQGTVDRDNKVIIKDNAYIGINAVIVGNVTIGKGSVIGANSVVTHDVPDYSVAVGSPAKIIKRYNSETKMWEKV